MRTPFLLATVLALSAVWAAAQTKLDVKDIQDHPFTADFNSGGKIRTISGGPRNDLEVTIEVPRKTGLFVRMPAGNLEVRHVVGDKDAELHAGEMIIDVGEAADYSRVDASVYSGGLEASPFGESHGGLFRSFHKEGNGRYHLHAHVGAGDLTLQ